MSKRPRETSQSEEQNTSVKLGKSEHNGGDTGATDTAAEAKASSSSGVEGAEGAPSTGRHYTVSIAVPGSIVANAQSQELRTYLVGQIARAAAIFQVDEIVVFDDGTQLTSGSSVKPKRGGGKDDSVAFMARLLQYIETPQYLRRSLFPMHPDLKFAGLLNPLAAPHHLRQDEWCRYREGVVLDRPLSNKKAKQGSLVNVGLHKECRIDVTLVAGVRVTVEMDERTRPPNTKKLELTGANSRLDTAPPQDPENFPQNSSLPTKVLLGRAVSPRAPREQLGVYWGYEVRIANTFSEVFTKCPYDEGYDLTVGTSERGHESIDNPHFNLPPFKHMLLVFGGVNGLEDALDADESLAFLKGDIASLFDKWVNTCPRQGSGTIRTEEAVVTSLAAFQPFIPGCQPHASLSSQST
eukprot:gb/GECG01000666.1/.p1 GENE.gb/GECG01000666.1/~~gb/GECG01000666.1/.p1  ORF type:complete len:410 (+),score=49.29 gb/GECG01000666.1/:1-1230(+)